MLTPLVSSLFGGPSITAESDLAPGEGVIGRPVWDATLLLAQLELRLGLPRPDISDVVRLQRWSAILRRLAQSDQRFYCSSYAIDPLGTARTLLEWRDDLRLAGWDGLVVPDGGSRLRALAELERSANLSESAPGAPDRLRIVSRELDTVKTRMFEGLELAEERALWPALWRRVFAQLEACGVAISTKTVSLPAIAEDSDLARVQAALRGKSLASGELTGDGSVIWLEAETTWELAQAAAAVVHAESGRSGVVIRAGEVGALDAALATHGVPSQGLMSRSAWRPALQVLPLALELAFEPRDPRRVFELVTMPWGPFMGKVGRELAKALAAAPGIGGRPWEAAKQRMRDAGVADQALQRMSDWLEGPTHDPARGAAKESLCAVARRVHEWLDAELIRGHAALSESPTESCLEQRVKVLGAAAWQTAAFEQALEHDPRELLSLVDVRHLLEETTGVPQGVVLAIEGAGRVDHVARPAGVRATREVVLWWHCIAGTERQVRLPPWRTDEMAALADAGVRFIDSRIQLAAEVESWIAPVLAARTRLVFAVPRSALGNPQAPHPVLDELEARMPPGALDCVRFHVRDWLGPEDPVGAHQLYRVSMSISEPLELPPARNEWVIAPACLAGAVTHSATSVESLVGCPLKWVLRHRAGLHHGANEAIPVGPLLNGKLGHRLIEELHAEGTLSDPERVRARSRAVLDRLISNEAGTLLCAGQSSEIVQLKAQICASIEALSVSIARLSLEIVGVETEVRATSRGRDLAGRIDLLLADQSGREIVLDLKWGSTHYAELLTSGRAVQLAFYAGVRSLSRPAVAPPRCGYFSLSRAEVISSELDCLSGNVPNVGATSLETWRRVEATLVIIEEELREGRVGVTGVERSLPISARGDGPANDGGDLLPFERGAACKYCDYAPICGRSWEGRT